MGRKKDNIGQLSQKFECINKEYEAEILEVYAVITESDQDFYLKLLKKFFKKLLIPKWFTTDVIECVDYFYEIKGNVTKASASKKDVILQMISTFTISSQVVSDDDIIDIVDIDKLIKYTNKLLQFRDNFHHIKQSWLLFVEPATSPSLDSSETNRQTDELKSLDFKLTLPALKLVKTHLNLDSNSKHPLGDGFLIDMLSCCATDDLGNLYNYDLKRQQEGLFVGFKDFAYILGALGEYD